MGELSIFNIRQIALSAKIGIADRYGLPIKRRKKNMALSRLKKIQISIASIAVLSFGGIATSALYSSYVSSSSISISSAAFTYKVNNVTSGTGAEFPVAISATNLVPGETVTSEPIVFENTSTRPIIVKTNGSLNSSLYILGLTNDGTAFTSTSVLTVPPASSASLVLSIGLNGSQTSPPASETFILRFTLAQAPVS